MIETESLLKVTLRVLTTVIDQHGLPISDTNILNILPLCIFIGYFAFLRAISNHLVSITMKAQSALIIYSFYSDFKAITQLTRTLVLNISLLSTKTNNGQKINILCLVLSLIS